MRGLPVVGRGASSEKKPTAKSEKIGEEQSQSATWRQLEERLDHYCWMKEELDYVIWQEVGLPPRARAQHPTTHIHH